MIHGTGIALAALVLALPITPPALAQTAEETVAYAFYGLADNAELTHGKTHLKWLEVSASPAVFTGHGEGGARTYDVTFTITAIDDCDYEVMLAGPPNMVRGGKALYARISLDKVDQIVGEALQVKIEGVGYCQTGALNPNCTPVHQTDIYGALDPEKHARLVAELHSVVCTRQ
jgi:hypothetical protein